MHYHEPIRLKYLRLQDQVRSSCLVLESDEAATLGCAGMMARDHRPGNASAVVVVGRLHLASGRIANTGSFVSNGTFRRCGIMWPERSPGVPAKPSTFQIARTTSVLRSWTD